MEEDQKEHKINVALKKDTIELLDEVAKKKVDQAMEEGSFDIIDLIRTKRGRGVSYDSQINFLAKVYLALTEQRVLLKDSAKTNPQLKKVLDDLNNITEKYNFFIESDDKEK